MVLAIPGTAGAGFLSLIDIKKQASLSVFILLQELSIAKTDNGRQKLPFLMEERKTESPFSLATTVPFQKNAN